MGDFTGTLFILIFFPILWFFFTGLIMLHIRLDAKKKWHKNERRYPYFHYPFYKKLFLLGLRGAVDIFVVIATFTWNISVMMLVISGVWILITPNIVVSYVFRISLGIYGVSMFTKLGAYGLSPSGF